MIENRETVLQRASVKLDWLTQDEQNRVQAVLPAIAEALHDVFDGTLCRVGEVKFDGHKWVSAEIYTPEGMLDAVDRVDYVKGVLAGFLAANKIRTI
jgi:hypothetical protein